MGRTAAIGNRRRKGWPGKVMVFALLGLILQRAGAGSEGRGRPRCHRSLARPSTEMDPFPWQKSSQRID